MLGQTLHCRALNVPKDKAVVSELQICPHILKERKNRFAKQLNRLSPRPFFPTIHLCSICSTIPFSSLPPPPLPSGFFPIADEDNLPELFYDGSERISKDSALGFPWHENLDALDTSAKLCPLCKLIQKGVKAWLPFYNEASANSKPFVKFNKSKASTPRGQQLWLAKRFGEGPGFIVLVRGSNEARRLILLTAVRFSVEASTYSRNSPGKWSFH
jgi:hypothetical protein